MISSGQRWSNWNCTRKHRFEMPWKQSTDEYCLGSGDKWSQEFRSKLCSTHMLGVFSLTRTYSHCWYVGNSLQLTVLYAAMVFPSVSASCSNMDWGVQCDNQWKLFGFLYFLSRIRFIRSVWLCSVLSVQSNRASKSANDWRKRNVAHSEKERWMKRVYIIVSERVRHAAHQKLLNMQQ